MATRQEQEARSTDASATEEQSSGGDNDIKVPEFYVRLAAHGERNSHCMQEGLKSISQAMTENGASDDEVQATLQNAKQYYLWRK